MKRINYLMGIILVAMAVMTFSCEDDPKEIDPLVGTYVFTSATFNDTVPIKIQQMDMTFLPGSDAGDFVGPGLLGAAPCDNPENAAIELKDDGTSYYACLTEETPEQMGTWSINTDRTILTLNISVPQIFSLNISDLDIKTTSFGGIVENFPLPRDASVELGAILPGGIPNYQVASVDVMFTKVP